MAQRERRQVPEVRRPRGAAWRALQREGLDWEGQAFLVGTDFDLAARLIVTRERLAVIRGGAVILDTPRAWLRPAPRLLADGNVLLTILAEDQAETAGNPETLLVRMREGWVDASRLVTLLGGSGTRRHAGPRPANAAWTAPVMPVEEPEDAEDSLAWARPAAKPTASETPSRPRPAQASGARTLPFSIESTGQDRDPSNTSPADPPWSRRRRTPPPIDVPVGTRTTRENIVGSNDDDPFVLPAPAAPAAVGRHYDWNLPPSEVVPSRERRRRRGWFFRLGSLLTLVAVVGVVAVLSSDRNGGKRVFDGARIVTTTGPGGDAGIAAATATPDTAAGAGAPPTTAAPSPSIPPSPTPTLPPPTSTPGQATNPVTIAGNEETAIALGVGSDLSPTATRAPIGPPIDPASVLATHGAEPGETLSGQSTRATATAPAPTATATRQTLSSTPTETPLPVATATPELSTATPVPPSPTAEPPTEEPTATTEPATEPPTMTPEPPTATATPEPTATPSATPEPVIPAQQASVTEEGHTAPAMEAGALRLTVESTMKGPALPELGLPTNPYGDWLVAIVYVYNWSDSDATLVMENFGLVTASPYVDFMPLDSGTSLVGSSMGLALALDPTDVEVFAPGEGHRVGLLFTANPSGRGFSLQYGQTALSLQSSLESSPNVDELGPPPPEPSLLEATVTEVIDGDTIAVEVDGVEATIRYAGVRAPAPDDCYGPEANAANEALVSPGDTVYLERESTNADADGALLRDVWIDLDGASILVANELAAVGAVDVLPDTPNDRFTSWLSLTVAEATFQGAGMWGACGGDAGDGTGAVALLPRPPAGI